jgi:hypothetical protein
VIVVTHFLPVKVCVVFLVIRVLLVFQVSCFYTPLYLYSNHLLSMDMSNMILLLQPDFGETVKFTLYAQHFFKSEISPLITYVGRLNLSQ